MVSEQLFIEWDTPLKFLYLRFHILSIRVKDLRNTLISK